MWSQVLGQLENRAEHCADRTLIVLLITTNYRAEYAPVFDKLPELSNLPARAAPNVTQETIDAWMAVTTGR